MENRIAHGTLSAAGVSDVHLFIADEAGGQVVADLLCITENITGDAVILYVEGADGAALAKMKHAIAALSCAVSIQPYPTMDSLLPHLHAFLSKARARVRVYATGSESLISRVVETAIQYGIHHDNVQVQHSGSLARRVQCVHCKGITEDVKTDIVVCRHCRLNLFVRDHYSRRIGAFQGVCVDAEAPGEVPEAKERYP